MANKANVLHLRNCDKSFSNGIKKIPEEKMRGTGMRRSRCVKAPTGRKPIMRRLRCCMASLSPYGVLKLQFA